MGAQFLDDLSTENCGIVKENGEYLLKKERIEEPSHPPGLGPYKWTIGYLMKKGILRKVRLKACVTGPFTLASYVKIRTGAFPACTAVSDIKKVRQLANTISQSCKTLAQDAYIISVDEPILSITIGRRHLFGYDEREIVEVYDDLKRACGNRLTGTHICGRISPRLADLLLQTELDFLSHEFHDTPENFNVYNRRRLLGSGKVLSVGCVSSRNPIVETVEEISEIMQRSKECGDDLIFSPDCGFKNLRVNGSADKGYEIATSKLRNLVEALKKLGDED